MHFPLPVHLHVLFQCHGHPHTLAHAHANPHAHTHGHPIPIHPTPIPMHMHMPTPMHMYHTHTLLQYILLYITCILCEYRVSRIPLEMNSKALSPLLGPLLHLIQTLPRWAMVLVDVIEHGSSHMVPLVVDVIEHGSSHMEGMVPLFAKELDVLSPLLDSFLHLSQTPPRWAKV